MAVGEVDVDALLGRLSSRQIAEWMAYYSLEPFGEERADLRSAQVACLIANANRDEKKHPQPFTVEDFMPKFDGEPDKQKGEQTWEQKKAIMKLLGAR